MFYRQQQHQLRLLQAHRGQLALAPRGAPFPPSGRGHRPQRVPVLKVAGLTRATLLCLMFRARLVPTLGQAAKGRLRRTVGKTGRRLVLAFPPRCPSPPPTAGPWYSHWGPIRAGRCRRRLVLPAGGLCRGPQLLRRMGTRWVLRWFRLVLVPGGANPLARPREGPARRLVPIGRHHTGFPVLRLVLAARGVRWNGRQGILPLPWARASRSLQEPFGRRPSGLVLLGLSNPETRRSGLPPTPPTSPEEGRRLLVRPPPPPRLVPQGDTLAQVLLSRRPRDPG